MKRDSKKINAPLLPHQNNVSLVERYIKDIKTSQESVNEWFQGYAYRHLHRIAYDLELIRNTYSPNDAISILEIGSIPLLLTLPLKELGL